MHGEMSSSGGLVFGSLQFFVGAQQSLALVLVVLRGTWHVAGNCSSGAQLSSGVGSTCPAGVSSKSGFLAVLKIWLSCQYPLKEIPLCPN